MAGKFESPRSRKSPVPLLLAGLVLAGFLFTALFLLRPSPEYTTPEPTAAPTPAVFHEMVLGSRGEEVLNLQNRLIELGYLAEGTADGAYGNMTANAVRAAQKVFGMAEDGIASVAFQTRLFQ